MLAKDVEKYAFFLFGISCMVHVLFLITSLRLHIYYFYKYVSKQQIFIIHQTNPYLFRFRDKDTYIKYEENLGKYLVGRYLLYGRSSLLLTAAENWLPIRPNYQSDVLKDRNAAHCCHFSHISFSICTQLALLACVSRPFPL